ncbi:hypothetical protein Tco_0625588, partial [Tanacetum coccineum]
VLSYDESKSRRVSERAFMTLFGQDNETFTSTMFLYVDQLQNQLDKDEFQEDKSMAAFWVLNNQFQKFIDWQYFLDYDSEMTKKFFVEYTRIQVKQFRETLLLHMGNVKKSVAERTHHKRQYDRRMNERQMQSRESKDVLSKALDASLVVTECSRTKSDEHITSSSLGTYITHVVDADIRPVNGQVLSAEVHLTAQHNVLANEQLHTDQSDQRGGEIEQDAEQYKVKSPLLNAEFVKSKEMIEKEMNNELSRGFFYLKNIDVPEFREVFEINDLKAQLQAKTTLICNLKNQIKSVKEASNEAKVKNDIDVIKIINIKLEHSVAKLLAANEQLHKENEHLKRTYKGLFDSIKKTCVQNKDNSDSLISQINQKYVENANLKALIQEKVFANATLKDELRKLKGNSMDTKFVKASILGKPPLQPSRNHSVVRQLNAFKESALAKPHHVNAPSSSKNYQKESYGSNDMAHNHFLEEARKKTQDKN